MRKIDLEEAQRSLRIAKDAIDEAIMEQPTLFYAVSDMLVFTKEEKDTAKLARDRVEAGVSHKLRTSLNREGTKFTESALREQVTLDRDYDNAQCAYLSALSEVTAWEHMKEAYSQRGFMIRELARLWTSNFYGENSVIGGNTSDIAASSNRSRMSIDRKERSIKRRALLK